MNCPINNTNCPYGKLKTGEKCPACGKVKKEQDTSYMIEKGRGRGRARKIMSAADRSAAAKKGWETRRRNGKGGKGKADAPSTGAGTRKISAEKVALVRQLVEESATPGSRRSRRGAMQGAVRQAKTSRDKKPPKNKPDKPANTPGLSTRRSAAARLGLGEGMPADFVPYEVDNAVKRGSGGGRNRTERTRSIVRSVQRQKEKAASANPRVQAARAKNPAGAKALKSLGLPEEAAIPPYHGSTNRPTWSGGSYGITIGGTQAAFDSMDEMKAAAKKLRDAGVSIGDFELWD